MKISVLVILLLSFRCFGQSLSISPINDSVFVATTWQTLESGPYPANSLYIVTQKGVILIDTPWDTTQVLPLLDTIRKRHGQPVVLCISTHLHGDRTGGFNILNAQQVPTWSSALTKHYCIERNMPLAANTFVNDTTFSIGGTTFETFFPGAGHAPDNIVLWFPKWNLLYGGCFIKSLDSTTPGYLGDADLRSWSTALKAVKRRYKKMKIVIPGHEQWGGKRLLKHTLKLTQIKT